MINNIFCAAAEQIYNAGICTRAVSYLRHYDNHLIIYEWHIHEWAPTPPLNVIAATTCIWIVQFVQAFRGAGISAICGPAFHIGMVPGTRIDWEQTRITVCRPN